jgi:predicted DNA helicase
LKNRVFSTVFIDEAAQALEPATWIPISKAHRVVLAGDHCQLPPTVKSQQAMKEGLGKTLMEKMIAHQPETAKMLQVQYRMNTQIMEFSNQQFYHGELSAHESVADRSLSPTLPHSIVEFIDTAGCSFDEKTLKESTSKYNPEEATLLVKHLTQLCEEVGKQEPSFKIGVISPYSAQVSYLEDLIKEDSALQPYLPHIRVSSVDGFQGQECNVIYISLVRSNEQGEVGFLGDTRRMNVALTRAKQKLVVIGDSATLGMHKFYQDFLAYIEGIEAYKSAWEFLS